MTGWIEQRILLLEQKLASQYRTILGLTRQLRAVQQGLTAANQQSGAGTGGGGGAGAFACVPSSSLVATGPPPSGSPANETGVTVYQFIAGSWVALPGTYTVYNAVPGTVFGGFTCWLVPDGAGAFIIYSQSCA